MIRRPATPRRPARALALAAALAALAPLAPDASAEPTPRERRIRAALVASAAALYIVSETVAKDAISPDTCRWCSANGLDARARSFALWDDPERARLASDLVGYVTGPLVTTTLLLAASQSWTAYGDDVTSIMEAVWGTQFVVQLVKISAGRQRPYAHYRTDPAPLAQEDNLSFPSGHTALTVSLAVGAGVLAQRRGYRLAPVIWSSGLAIAAATAYLRMAADRHYLTDVLTGGAVGALGGALIPRFTGSLPARATVVPQPGGLALVGHF